MSRGITSRPHPVEAILATGLKRLLAYGIPMSAVALVFPAPGPEQGLYPYVLVHLLLVQVVTFLFTLECALLTDEPWFQHVKRPWLASSASLVAAAVGYSALLTLATSAAARYDPSLQFLQLLSSLDIAWVVAALYLGSRRLWGRSLSLVLGSMLLVACVASIAIYLRVVGFTESGGWLVNGGEMMRIVLPSDTVAAIIAATALWVASVRADQRTAQPSPQS